MLSPLMRFALVGALVAGLPAMAAAETPAMALRPVPHEVAPAARPNTAVSAPSLAPSRKGAVDRIPISVPTAPATAPVTTQPVVSGAISSARLVTDVGPLGVRPAFAPIKILYAVADLDDPALRAAISAITGGPVDYFDARGATPTAVQLGGYNCVYTMPDYLYADATLMGDRLADYVDAGGKVILGPFSTYDIFALGGRIRTPPYSPVTSPGSGTNHYANSAYAGDGFRSMHAGVLAYD